jgi:hypothetical protein
MELKGRDTSLQSSDSLSSRCANLNGTHDDGRRQHAVTSQQHGRDIVGFPQTTNTGREGIRRTKFRPTNRLHYLLEKATACCNTLISRSISNDCLFRASIQYGALENDGNVHLQSILDIVSKSWQRAAFEFYVQRKGERSKRERQEN